MSPIVAIVIAAFAAGQAGDGVSLAPGQELVYRGTYCETTGSDAAPFRQSLDFETRVFVCDCGAASSRVAFCTTLRSPNAAGPGAVRFELATVDRQGRVRFAGHALPPFAPDGPPALECAGFLARPLDAKETWVNEEIQPPMTWRMAAHESVHGVRCIKCEGVQETTTWLQVVANRPGWRRVETVWLSAATGIVERVDRQVEWRSNGPTDSLVRTRTTYDLQGGVSTYPGPLSADRRNEIEQADRLQQELRQLRATRAKPAAFEALIARIDGYLDSAPATPFRPAILAIRRGADSARRGEPPPPGRP